MIELEDIIAKDGGLDRDRFVALHRHPLLLFLRSERGRRLTAEAQREAVGRRSRRLTKDMLRCELETGVFLKERLGPLAGQAQSLALDPSAPRQFLGVGRDASCDVVLSHKTVAPRHACLFPGRQWRITDMGTQYGTWVRGKSIPPMKPFELMNQDDLRFGTSQAAVFLTPHGFYELVQACRA